MRVQNYSENGIEKTAFLKGLVGGTTKVISTVSSFAKGVANLALKAGAFGLAGAGAIGGGVGYLAARATSPDIATATAEQDVAQEALETEIDIVKRQIAQLERKKAAEKRAQKTKVYDRFVG